PQQLRGEAASPADDVYGLGALAHELLTRYPPFYPHFDAQRVQAQDPPRPVPVHGAPTALLDLVQAMLMRDGAARPSLGEVTGALERCLAATDFAEEGATVVEAPQVAPVQAQRAPRSGIIWWWALGAAAAGGLALVLFMPRPTPEITLQSSEEAAPVIPSVADALVVEEPAAPAAAEDDAATAEATPAAAPARPTLA